ncbi:hypothetical protein M501DRAFT_929280 [Patellaria atrata CBS 101060]|uniref:Structure-specific endonuclease subunit SLX1 n=1 Tax=Patellaria atrata CBS 101060 TaxID=1346257 RepID=A0A9P4SEU2_9PEZI|nr:hypothetical protein M501DRAFT_929280 [Patellaria atrata CBS 101060]
MLKGVPVEKVIPPFYCCYLLRSTVSRTFLYVGSTPNPVRRLRQHNGDASGGAVRTKGTEKRSLRPWEMACIVTGFPSKIAALQFEWAWQNTHVTRHIPDDDRITSAKSRNRTSPASGKERTRPVRPRISVGDKMANLHLLLRVKSFARWPLAVKFFDENLYRVWQRCDKKEERKIDGSILIELETKSSLQQGASDPALLTDVAKATSGIHSIDVTYKSSKEYIAKSQSVIQNQTSCCTICQDELEAGQTPVLICSHGDCKSASHMTCLSQHFLQAGVEKDALLPTTGTCPECKQQLRWIDLVKDLSLRTRGDKEVEMLFKQRKQRARKIPGAAGVAAVASTATASLNVMSDEDDSIGIVTDNAKSIQRQLIIPEPLSDDSDLDDNWAYKLDDDDDQLSVVSEDSSCEDEPVIMHSGSFGKAKKFSAEAIIEDSEEETGVMD